MNEKKITFDSFIRGTLSLAIFAGVIMLIERLSGVLLPFFIAWFVAYMLYPLVIFFQKKVRLRNRVLSIFCAMLTVCIVGGVLFYLIIPPMIEEFWKVKDLLTLYLSSPHSANIPDSISHFLHEKLDISSLLQGMDRQNIVDTAKEMLPPLWNLLSGSFSILFSIIASFITLLYLFFILLDYEEIAEGWIHFVPTKHRTLISQLANDMKVGMNRYFRGQALVALCVGILFSIGFLIIDFPLAIGLGLFIGFLNMVPYLQIVGIIPTVLLAILKAADTGGNFWLIILAAMVVFAVVQIIQDALIVPHIMGKITGMNPAIILLSLSVWGSLMGVIGMIIALPISTLLISYYKRYLAYKEKKNEKSE